MELDRDVGTPFVHISMDLKSPVTPRHRLMCQVDPTKLGETSIGFRVIARQDGVECFEGRFVCVFTVASEFRKRKAPPEIVKIVTPLLVDAETA
jgi:acyl-CoA thioesterase FadM